MAKIDLWLSAEADLTPELLDAYRNWLSADETARWQRFRREEDRDRHLLARGLVRGVLAGYTDQPPSELAFGRQAQGKPVLQGLSSPLHFNLSHTRGLVVLAVSREAELGIDIEAIDLKLDPLQLARQHFSASERAVLDCTPENQQQERFFDLWTLKEAYLKALGQGLGRDLTGFSVMLDPSPPRIVEHDASTSQSAAPQAAACQCRLYAPRPGYRLALVALDADRDLDITVACGLPLQGFGSPQAMCDYRHRS